MNVDVFLQPLVLSAIITLVIIPPVIRLAKRYNIIAMVQQTRWHRQPIPLLGGVGIFISSTVSYFILCEEISWLFLGGSVASFATGLWDDVKEKGPLFKVAGQLLAAACLLIAGVTFNTGFYLTDCLSTLAWTVLITNSINLLDNMDGAAAGISAIITGICGVVLLTHHFNSIALISFCCMGAGIGFLFFNFKPASIFMGDSGSLLLGYYISFLSISTAGAIASSPGEEFLTCLILLALPLTDTLFVIFSRINSGISIFQGGKDHLAHRMAAKGYKEVFVILCLYGLTLLWTSGILLKKFTDHPVFLIFTAIISIVTIVFCWWLSFSNNKTSNQR